MCLDVVLFVYFYLILIVFCDFEFYAFYQTWKVLKYYIKYCLFHLISPSGNPIYLLIYAFHKYVLSTYYLPAMFLDIGNIMVNKADKKHCLHILYILSYFIHVFLFNCGIIDI